MTRDRKIVEHEELEELLRVNRPVGLKDRNFQTAINRHYGKPLTLRGVNVGKLIEFIPLSNAGEPEFDFSHIKFIECVFDQSLNAESFKNLNIRFILHSAKFSGCSFDSCKISFNCGGQESELVNSKVTSCQFSGRPPLLIEDSTFSNSKLSNTEFIGRRLQRVSFSDDCNLSRCKFERATLFRVDFGNSNLEYADFTAVAAKEITISGHSKVHSLKVDHDNPNHSVDGELEYKFKHSADSWFTNWGVLKWLGNTPVFTASWVALAISLILLSTLVFLNETEVLTIIRDYPIELPDKLIWFMYGTLSLFTGAALFQVYCPEDVQTYSLTQWVRERQKSRFQFEHLIRVNPGIRRACAAFLSFGGGVIVFLTLNRIWIVTSYLVRGT